MDRRQKKTREAIFKAFAELLTKKSYNQISVQEIIDAANIGRTTFYAHFETRDYLLKDMCEELFGHIAETTVENNGGEYDAACENRNDGVFLHLIRHLQDNRYNILGMMAAQDNEIFLRYFKTNLKKLIITQFESKGLLQCDILPAEYLVNHIAVSFVETVYWWISRNTKESPEEITGYFLGAVGHLITSD